jgi:hypothetical protein
VQSLVPLAAKMATKKLKKKINHQVMIKFQQKLFKQEVGQCILRSLNLLTLLGVKMNCLKGEGVKSLYTFIRKVMKETAVITEKYHHYQLHTKFYTASFCQD